MAVRRTGRVLAEMMHEEDRELVLALQGAELTEERRHLRGGVLVGLMEADERVEDQEPWPLLVEGLAQPRPIAGGVEAERGGEDETDREVTEREATRGGDAVEALLHVCGSILGGVEQDRSGLGDDEAAEGGRGAGDADREVQREPGLARSCRVPSYAASGGVVGS